MVRITPMDEAYEVSETENDLTAYWVNEGYVDNGDELIKEDVEVLTEVEEIRPVSDIQTLRVSKFRREGSVIALRKAFGDLAFEGTHIIINEDLIIPIRRGDRRVELTRYGFEGGEEIDVQIAQSETITETRRGVDTIPITEITYSVFIKGEYKPRNKAVERRFYVKGDKKVRVGVRAPIGLDSGEFWRKLFDRLKNDLKKEMLDKLTDEHEFNDGMIESPNFDAEILHSKSDLPHNSQEFKRGLRE